MTADPIERLVTDNIPLARFFASTQGSWLDRDEAYSVALIQLWEAAKRWTGKNGCKFGTFAGILIRHEYCRLWRSSMAKKRGGGVLHVSFEDAVGEDGGLTLAETIPDENTEAPDFEASKLEGLSLMEARMDALSPIQRTVLRASFGMDAAPKSHAEIGEEIGFCKWLVQKTEAAALSIIRDGIDQASKVEPS